MPTTSKTALAAYLSQRPLNNESRREREMLTESVKKARRLLDNEGDGESFAAILDQLTRRTKQ